MKHFVAILFLFVSAGAQAKGLMLLMGRDYASGGMILEPPNPATQGEPNVWTHVWWTRDEGHRWVGFETHLVPKDDPRIKKFGGRIVGFYAKQEGDSHVFEPYKEFDEINQIGSGSVNIVLDKKVFATVVFDVNEAEFVSELGDNRLQLAPPDQEIVKLAIESATAGMTKEQREQVEIRFDFHPDYDPELPRSFRFFGDDGLRALGMLPPKRAYVPPYKNSMRISCSLLLQLQAEPQSKKGKPRSK